MLIGVECVYKLKNVIVEGGKKNLVIKYCGGC